MIRQLRCVFLVTLVCALCQWMAPGRMAVVGSARASISCTASMSNLSFGNVDPYSSGTTASAALSYTCTNSGLATPTYSALICFSIGEPAGGPTNPRRMTGPSGNTLSFQLWQDPGLTIVWGSQFFGFNSPKTLSVTLAGGVLGGATTSGTIPLYGQVFNGQTTAVPGSYTDNYSPGDTAITINQVQGNTPPTTCSGTISAQFGSFTVSATVAKSCYVTANDLNFGAGVGLLTSAVTGSTTLAVQCSNGTPYNIGLDAGLNGGGNVNARKMLLGTDSVSYQLYQNAGLTQVWGNTVGTNTAPGTGTGNTQSYTVYGQVPPQTTPTPGQYKDLITVYVTY